MEREKGRVKKFIIMAMLGVSLWVSFTACATEADKDEEDLTRSLVTIQKGDISGSGVIWETDEDNVTIVTAGHVLDGDAADIRVGFCDGTVAESTTFVKATDSDVAFVKVDRFMLSDKTQKLCSRAVSKAGGESLEREQIVYAYELGEKGQTAHLGIVMEPWIYMEDFQQYMIYVNMQTYPGMSGTGLFDENNSLVGIVCGGTQEMEAAALPLSLIEAAYISENF